MNKKKNKCSRLDVQCILNHTAFIGMRNTHEDAARRRDAVTQSEQQYKESRYLLKEAAHKCIKDTNEA